jgi:hypothetical protein
MPQRKLQSPLAVYEFGVVDEETETHTNLLYTEGEGAKGSEYVVSLIAFFRKVNRGTSYPRGG